MELNFKYVFIEQYFELIGYYDWFNNWLLTVVDKYRDQQQCSDNTSIVIGVVLTVVIVIAIVMNIIGWRRKTGNQIFIVFVGMMNT